MPKKKIEKVMETRTMSKRAASKEALRQMQSIISEQAAYDSPEAALEITSEEEEEEEVVTVDVAPKRKYRLSHRKSSDGNDRDVLVLKNIGWKEETLKLDAWVEDLSPVQLELRIKSKNEIDDINTRLDKLLKDTSSEVIFQGDNTALFEFEKEVKEKQKNPQPNTPAVKSSKNNNQSGFQLVMDPRSGVVVGTMTPAPPPPPVITPASKPQTRKRTRASTNLSPIPAPAAKVAKQNTPSTPTPPIIQPRPTEATAVGGLSHGSSQKGAAVVDLTSDDGRTLADSREISFNKLQGKTFPSLVVVARPHLRVKDAGGVERGKLDAKVKSVLMHPPTKFTEWLIQQGLIRSEQSCTTHAQSKLKLGMYSDVSKFPFSGGYVWISECCPQRFVSVFSGSLFEGSPHPPSVILKLIYHWACQTNVQNVVQWVKVDNLYVKGLNTWLRATCTVALHTHIRPLGGPGKKVEVGVISLGTTSQDGHQRQVKVEVLGLLETEAKVIRLRAVEPLADGDRNYKKRFSKILEPLLHWVHPDSTIVTDLTVDKVTLHSMGFKYVMQTTSTDGVNNHTIMEYLRRIVPRMFQNTLSLLSRQIIQQFLDELVWREWFGTTAAQTFDNVVLHLAEQTRVDTGQSLIVRLNKVACNPFKNWSIKHYLNFQSSKPPPTTTAVTSTPVATTNTATETPTLQKRITKRKVTFKAPSPTPDVSRPTKSVSPDIPEQMVPLEHYYYGSIEGVKKLEEPIVLNLKCNMCKAQFTNNIKLMTHLFTHAHNVVHSGVHQCCYCLATMTSKEILDKHIALSHPADTRCGESLVCIICEGKFSNTYSLGKHMSKEHVPSELPYQCGTCQFRCSSHKQAVDHFYVSHNGAGAIQCPFCLKSTSVYSNGRMVPQNLSYFLQHLYKHQKKSYPKKCPKCALWFVQKDIIRDHITKMHVTQRRKAGLVPWPVPRVTIMVPKSRQEEPIEEEEVDISNVILDIQENLKCKECSINITSPNHYPALLYCSNNNCQFSTCCRHAMNKHSAECKIFHSTLPVQRMPFKMYCVCGYNDFDGNLMAKHLTVCERKSAYPSEEAAKAATVTHSMLDVLGLVRRPEEPVTTTNEIMEIDSDDDKGSDNQTKRLEKENNSNKNEDITDTIDLLNDEEPKKTDEVIEQRNDKSDNDNSNSDEIVKENDNVSEITNKSNMENLEESAAIEIIDDNAEESNEQNKNLDKNEDEIKETDNKEGKDNETNTKEDKEENDNETSTKEDNEENDNETTTKEDKEESENETSTKQDKKESDNETSSKEESDNETSTNANDEESDNETSTKANKEQSNNETSAQTQKDSETSTKEGEEEKDKETSSKKYKEEKDNKTSTDQDKEKKDNETSTKEKVNENSGKTVDVSGKQSKSHNLSVENSSSDNILLELPNDLNSCESEDNTAIVDAASNEKEQNDTKTKNSTEIDEEDILKNNCEPMEVDCSATLKQVLRDDSKTNEVNDIDHIVQ